MKFSPIPAIVLVLPCLILPGCHHSEAEEHQEEHHHKVVVTSPLAKDIISTQRYVCQIHSRRHIEVRALEGGYLDAIPVAEGQAVKQGDLMFKIVPVLFRAKLDSEVAEARQVEIEFNNTKKLYEQKVVAQPELKLVEAKLAKAQAKVKLAQAELNFTDIKAPFDGIIDRMHNQQGSLIAEGDILTTLSDNNVMWAYFNVPEKNYLEYKSDLNKHEDDLKIELELANHNRFGQLGRIGAIEADFNSEIGTVAFRADFPNSDGLLRHGQTGTVVISRVKHDAVVIPQRATFEILDRLYAFVVGEDGVVHQRDIVTENNGLDDIFVVQKGLEVNDKIILEGIAQVRDGETVDYEFRAPEEVLGQLKYKAE